MNILKFLVWLIVCSCSETSSRWIVQGSTSASAKAPTRWRNLVRLKTTHNGFILTTGNVDKKNFWGQNVFNSFFPSNHIKMNLNNLSMHQKLKMTVIKANHLTNNHHMPKQGHFSGFFGLQNPFFLKCPERFEHFYYFLFWKWSFWHMCDMWTIEPKKVTAG